MDEMTEKEQEQLRRFETFRRLVQSIILRRFWVPLLAFAIAFAALYAVLLARALRSDRFESRAVLIFHPRKSERVKSIDQKELYQILFRRSLKDRLAAHERGSAATDAFCQYLYRTVEFSKDDRQPDIFNVIVRAPTEKLAIDRANAFADLCLAEYADYRKRNLQNCLGLEERRRQESLDRLAALDREEDDLNASTHLLQPRQELERLNDSLSQQRQAFAEASIKLTKERSQLKKLRLAFERIPKAVIAHIDELKRFLADFGKVDAEIADAEALYTEKNPRMVVVRARRAALADRYAAFCRKAGIDPADVTALDKVETMENEIKAAESRTDVAQETSEAIEREISRGLAAIARLQEIVPRYDRIRHRREMIQQSLMGIDDAVSDIHYLQASIENDLGLLEPVNSADETPPIGRKKLIFIVMAAVVFTGFVSVAFVLLDILFGRVYDLRELTFYHDLKILGALPPPSVPFASRQEEKKILGGIHYRFTTEVKDVRLMTIARLPGARFSRQLHYEFNWNCAMGGKRLLRLEIVPAVEFDMTDDMTMIGGGIAAKNQMGFFPVQDISRLTPGEMLLLENDVKELREKYDIFVVGRRQPISNKSIYFSQMLEFCDVAVVFVGARTTTRAALRQLLQRQKKSGKPLFVVMSGERNMNLVRKGV